ncbi:MAG TPA: hypothetical protein VHZ95_18625 [Polyangiales bacterium]|nr:hypothetical protein [Polyangiales bacterium]
MSAPAADGGGLSRAAADDASARAADVPLKVEIQGEDSLPRSAHVGLPVILQLKAASSAPLLLTPRIEGSAVEVVRGRLSRSDGKVLDETHLRFEIPIVARSEGTAILRVDVNTYACERRCVAISASATRVLHVH